MKAELIKKEQFGGMVAIQNNQVVSVPLEDIAGKLKYISPEDGIITNAKQLGISFGDWWT